MGSAAPHVKLLRQLSDARDDYLSGALDLGWDGGQATLFLVFGQPSHAVFQSDDLGTLEGDRAVEALLRDLPGQFTVGPWRRAMSPSETLSCTVEDLVAPLAELTGAHAPSDPDEEATVWLTSGDDDSPHLPFDHTSFPLLPAGEALWVTAPASEVGLSQVLQGVESGLVLLSGTRLRAAGVVDGGQLVDAVWVDEEAQARGEAAAMALLGARDGTLAGTRLPGAQVAEALTLLWRLPVEHRDLDAGWLDPASLIDSFQRDGADRVVLVDGPVRGVGLFVAGRLVCSYGQGRPHPSGDPALMAELIAQPGARLTVLRGLSRSASPRALSRHAAAVHSDQSNGELVDGEPDDEAGSALGVDFGEVKRELVQIGVSWLGERDSEQLRALIKNTRPTIDDFVSTLDVIRTMQVVGHEPSVVLAMAREMHYHAAERLCGA